MRPLPVEELTPRQIVAELDKYIVGQEAAKRAVAVALRNRCRRQQLAPADADDVVPKNILMIGPTGVGKTEIARRLAQLARAPFVKVEATKFTEVGYVGRDVDAMVRDLAAASMRLVEREWLEAVRPEAEAATKERLVDLVSHKYPLPRRKRKEQAQEVVVSDPSVLEEERFWPMVAGRAFYDEPSPRALAKRRARIAVDIESGVHDAEFIDIDQEEAASPFLQVFTPQGMEEMGLETGGLSFPPKRSTRRLSLKEARESIVEEEARKLIDQAGLRREAIRRAEQTGIIFIDEIDKIAIKSTNTAGPDVSREGVQRDLLPVVEGSTVATKFGPVNTDHVLFICAGAFHISKPSDLIPELQGRLPIRVELQALTTNDFERILIEPKNSLIRQYQLLLAADGVQVSFTDDALAEIAGIAAAVNERYENIGARRLHTVMERLLEPVLYEAPEGSEKCLTFDAVTVSARLAGILRGESSRNIL